MGSSPCIDHGQKGNRRGYGRCLRKRDGKYKTCILHREVFFKHNSYYPEVVMHTCDNPRCINPEHLVGGTQADNVQDMITKGRKVVGYVPTKLTTEAIAAIQCSTLSEKALGLAYGISAGHAGRVRRGGIIG